jgi:CheY-like chemotaxis protein
MKNLLLVDSDMTVQQWAEANFSSEGFEVTSYGDGLSALDMLSKIDPDVVLAEYRLAGMNVFRFCEKLRQKDGAKKRSLFILCDSEDAVDPGRLEAAGVDGIIHKPMVLTEVLKTVRGSGEQPAQTAEKAPGPGFVPEDDAEGQKMEELLGWGKAEGAPATGPSDPGAGVAQPASAPVTPPEEDRTVVAGIPRPEDEATVMFADTAGASDSRPEEAAASANADSRLISGSMAELAQVSVRPAGGTGSPASQPAPSAIPEKDIEAAVSKAAREIIEKVAWEVVPTIAEALIKEELEKLKSEIPD